MKKLSYLSLLSTMLLAFYVGPAWSVESGSEPGSEPQVRVAPKPDWFADKWNVAFTFERNTRKIDENRHPWFNFTLDLHESGDELIGTLQSTDQKITGKVWGKIYRGKFRGTMRLSWDSKEWESLTINLIPGGKRAEGTAVYQASPDEKHFYILQLERK